MKYPIISFFGWCVLLGGIFALSEFASNATAASNNDSNVEANTAPLKSLSWEGQKEKKKFSEMQEAIDQQQFDVRVKYRNLQEEFLTHLAAASNSQTQLSALIKRFADAKTIIPRDPWREIYGEVKFVNSPNSGFVKFDGRILESAANGIRVLGRRGNSDNQEYFVLNFPYKFSEGENIDPTKIYSAFEDGDFSFITEDGFAKKIPKLNYGKPCPKPKSGDEVELAARQALTPTETLDVAALRQQLVSQKAKAVQINLDQAERGESNGFRRLAERYRDGDGVQVDPSKSTAYFQKYEDALQAEADRQLEADRKTQQETLKQKLQRNIFLAETKDNVHSLLYLSVCFSNGIGTEIDLDKAKTYYEKAVGVGLPRRMNEKLY
jgi:TPR repeat protein